MCQIIQFPQERIRPYRSTPVITYSLDDYGNNPPLEYENFRVYNNVYLNDRKNRISVLFPAHMLGNVKRFFSEALRMIARHSTNQETNDPGKAIYNDMFTIVHSIIPFENYSIANNTVGKFGPESQQVSIDILVTLHISDSGVLKIGFKRDLFRWSNPQVSAPFADLVLA